MNDNININVTTIINEHGETRFVQIISVMHIVFSLFFPTNDIIVKVLISSDDLKVKKWTTDISVKQRFDFPFMGV